MIAGVGPDDERCRVCRGGGRSGIEGPTVCGHIAEADVLELDAFGQAAGRGPGESGGQRGIDAGAVVHHGAGVEVEGPFIGTALRVA